MYTYTASVGLVTHGVTCERCGLWFKTSRAMNQHREDSTHHNVCRRCLLDFPTRLGLTQHYVQSSQHFYCERCDLHFSDDKPLDAHLVSAHYYCPTCRKHLNTRLGLDEHNRQVHTKLYYPCPECDRAFQTENSLKAHLRSKVHGARSHVCPGRNCGRSFITNADLTAHLEAGTCPSGVTRDRLNEFVARQDKGGIITNPSRLLTGPDGTSTSHPVITQYATERSWNGYAYECALCRDTFRSLRSLNAHLGSAAHAERIYRCPVQFGGCGVEFAMLSGLMHHVESGRCPIHRFQKRIDSVVDDITAGMARIGWK